MGEVMFDAIAMSYLAAVSVAGIFGLASVLAAIVIVFMNVIRLLSGPAGETHAAFPLIAFLPFFIGLIGAIVIITGAKFLDLDCYQEVGVQTMNAYYQVALISAGVGGISNIPVIILAVWTFFWGRKIRWE